ncbi:MAG: hypothetical protein LBJ67_07335 [Planctomycetaceae bacterium]|nr:hypothetical protein [Planctomycetaceae bacterium]
MRKSKNFSTNYGNQILGNVVVSLALFLNNINKNLCHLRIKKHLVIAVTLATMLLCNGGIFAEEKEKTKELPKISVREIFVPNSEMATLLENCKDRVLLSREEFETLLLESLQQQSKTPDEPEAVPPNPLVFLSSGLTIVVEGEQAKIKAVLEWESFSDKWQTASLPLENVAVHSALLNGDPAKLGIKPQLENSTQTNQAEYLLFLRGKGRHKLELELTTPLYLDAVRQELRFQIPYAPKTAETLAVPGDVELKEGAMIVRREVKGEGVSRMTRFELLPKNPSQHLVLTLNSHRTRKIRSVLARSVQFAEVTEHYEKLHATVSLDVLHQPIPSAEFIVPSGFEMTEVTSPQLARWSVTERDKKTVLEVRFHEPVSGLVLIHLTAEHFFEIASAVETLSEWAFPAFQPLDVNNDSAVFGLLVDTQWNVHQLNAARLIPIAPQILNNAIPDSVFDVSVDAPVVRTAAAWYAPNTEKWSIVCEFLKPKPAFDATSHQVLTLNDKEETLRGLLQVAPRYEKLFELTLESPEHWTVVRVTNQQDVALPFEQKGKNVRIKIVNGISAGTVFPLIFEAKGNTPGWFGSWDEQKLAFPQFCLTGAASDSGTIAVDVENDMRVTSENDVRLVPLDSKERTEFLAGLPTDMAFRYMSQPYSTDLKISREESRLTARTFAFFQFAPSLLSASYEVHYNVEQAQTKSLSFLLPVNTPENIGIQGMSGLVIKEYVSSPIMKDGKEYRKWDVQLANPVAGNPVLGVNFEQTRSEKNGEKNNNKEENNKENVTELPLILADNAVWQSELFSVEGHEELNLSIENDLENNQEIRQVDVGELAATQYIPGRRLLGVYEGVTPQNPLKIRVERNPDFQLPASIVQLVRGEIEIAADGKRIAKAVYDLKTRAVFLKIGFYRNEEIWSVSLDGQTVKLQKDANGILVDIPAKDDAAIRELEIIWAIPGNSKSSRIFASSDIQLPVLLVPQKAEDSEKEISTAKKQTETGTIVWQNIPVTRIAWNITAPPGYDVIRIGNQTLSEKTPRPILLRYVRGIVGCEWLTASKNISHWGIDYSAPLFESAKKAYDSPHPTYSNDQVEYSMRDSAPSSALPSSVGEGLIEDEKKSPATSSGYKSDVSKFAFYQKQDNSKRKPKSTEAVPYQKQTLQTVRPVQVTLQKNLSSPLQKHLQFQFIGDNSISGGNAVMNVRMVNTRLITFGFYLVWGVVFAAGLWLLKSTVRVKTIFVLAVMIAGTLFVLLPGLEVFAKLFDEAVKAAFGIMVVYLIHGGWQKLTRSQIAKPKSSVSVEKLMVISLLAITVFVCANRQTFADGESEKPLVLPDGAIAVFYDEETLAVAQNGNQFPDPKILTRNDQKLLVPYAKYQELWKLVHPDEKTAAEEKLPVDYAVTFGEYTATLNAADDLVIHGKAEIELSGDNAVLFPIPIQRGILTSLKVDDKDAEITTISLPQPLPQQTLQSTPQQQQYIPQQQAVLPQQISPQNVSSNESPQNGMFVVQIRDKGKHTLEWTARFKVERQGGWRSVTGTLPKFPAGKMRVTLPEEWMEFRCTEVSGQHKWIAERASEVIDTSLDNKGKFHWSWRSKITEAEIDRSLTADSELQFNVQEDSLVLNWDLSLTFRRGKQEAFLLRIPKDYLVAEVTGENVRGWENVEAADNDSANNSQINVELLHPTEGNDHYHIVLLKKADFSENKPYQIAVPNVGVTAAAMHHGRITIQHSPRFEIKTDNMSNVTMTDMPNLNASAVSNIAEIKKITQSPLGITAFRAYRFMTEDYLLPITVDSKRDKDRDSYMNNHNIVKLTPHEIKLESNFNCYYSPNDHTFKEALILPKGLKLDAVQSDLPIEWSTKLTESGETELTVLWTAIPDGRHVVFNILGTVLRNQESTVELPIVLRKENKNMNFTRFAVLTDPAFDVQISDVKAFQIEEKMNSGNDWITSAQRSLCRKILLMIGVKASAKLTLIPREPKVIGESITNVRMNTRSVEEMILLDYNIQNAGIHSVQFELPQEMADARIDAPLLQRKEIAETDHNAILVTLYLQDEIMNEFRVLIRNDRELISGKTYSAAIPKMLTGNVRNQYIVLENAGSRDELQVDAKDIVNVRKISRQQNEWRRLQEILGSGATEAYLVIPSAVYDTPENAVQDNQSGNPQNANVSKAIAAKLPFSMVRRETVKMSGAQIGLAETRVVVSENGQYLAEQIYRIDNKTEQFLDLKLPYDAKIWTVRILTSQEWNARESGQTGDFGQPVKPTVLPEDHLKTAKKQSFLRIPIVKTEVGDLDYIVRIVYAGTTEKIRWTSSLDIPFLESLNIPVAASYARLHLPKNYKFTFGGTMRESNQTAVTQTVSDYEKRVETKLQQTLQTGNPYEQTRAKTNLLQLGSVLSTRGYTSGAADEIRIAETSQPREQSAKIAAGRPGYEMQQENIILSQEKETQALSNSLQLQQRFESQSNVRGKNVVAQSSNNWQMEQTPSSSISTSSGISSNQQFDGKWLAENGFVQAETKGKRSRSDKEDANPAQNDSSIALDTPTFNGSHLPQASQQTPQQALQSGDYQRVTSPSDTSASIAGGRVSNANRSQQQAAQASLGQKLSNRDLASKLSGNSATQSPEIRSQPLGSPSPMPARPQTEKGSQFRDSGSMVATSSFSQSDAENIRRYEERLAQNYQQNAKPQIALNSSSATTPMLSRESKLGAAPSSDKISNSDANNEVGLGLARGSKIQPMEPMNTNTSGESMSGMGDSGSYSSSGGGYSGSGYGGYRDAMSGSMKSESGAVNMEGGVSSDASSMGTFGIYDRRVPGDTSGQQKGISEKPNNTVAAMTSTMGTKTASLDIEIPQTGTVYFFTAPKAEHRLSVRGISNASSQRVGDFVYILIISAVVGFVAFAVKKGCKKR